MTTQPFEEDWDDEEVADHYLVVVLNLLAGRVTPVLGAGASLYGRLSPAPPPATATSDTADSGAAGTPAAGGGPATEEAATSGVDADPTHWPSAPSAGELAAFLARKFRVRDSSGDLLRVAQWVYALRGGSGDLYAALHTVFAKEFEPTELHHFLAEIPGRLRETDQGRPQLIVTTNYDDLVERALDARGEPYDVLVYMAEGPHEGRFCHIQPDGALVGIDSPETYMAVDPDERTVLLKMHGYVCRSDADSDSYVITEDHYIEYLTRTDLAELLPKPVLARLLNSHLLFLGYSLRDWNFRAILYYIYHHRLHDNDWWAVLLKPDRLERKSWLKRHVAIVDIALETYIPALKKAFLAELSTPA